MAKRHLRPRRGSLEGFSRVPTIRRQHLLNDKYKVSMKAVQELLGHALESTTEIYVHSISSSLRDMAGMAIPQKKMTHLSAHKKEGVNDENR